MGESACLMHTLSYGSGISNEANQGNPIHALGESISFGRFMSESLSWGKWSSFSHNRYVEEAERYAQPGSVAQKKAFFEAHYKRIAAKKAAALLEQANNANTNPEPEFEGQACDITNSQVPVGEQLEVKNPGTEVDSMVNVNGYISGPILVELEKVKVKEADSVAEQEVVEKNPMKNESLNQIENVVNQYLVSEIGLGESPQMEKPLLKGFKSSQEPPSPVSKKKPAPSSSKPSIQRRATKVPATPAKPTAPPIHPRKETKVTPITRKTPIDSMDRKRSTSKSLQTLIYSTLAKEPDKSTTPAARKPESSRIAPSSVKGSKDCKTPIRTPVMAYANGVLKNPSATPYSENRRPRTPVDPSASGSKTTAPKWHILSAVSKSLSACRKKLQSPTLSAPFSLRTEERAARRKQKLEEKFNSNEAQKVQLQTRLKGKPETELRKLHQGLCFKARPLPDFYKERETPRNQIKNIKAPLTRTQSPKLGRKPSSSTLRGKTTLPPETQSTKNSGPKNVLKKRSQIPNPLISLPEMTTLENTSPNIRH